MNFSRAQENTELPSSSWTSSVVQWGQLDGSPAHTPKAFISRNSKFFFLHSQCNGFSNPVWRALKEAEVPRPFLP